MRKRIAEMLTWACRCAPCYIGHANATRFCMICADAVTTTRDPASSIPRSMCAPSGTHRCAETSLAMCAQLFLAGCFVAFVITNIANDPIYGAHIVDLVEATSLGADLMCAGWQLGLHRCCR